jgi:hypothetical protein
VQSPRRPTPEEKYLDKKRAELAIIEAQLAERELELHTMRGSLVAFEKQYEAIVSERYAQLEELHVRIAELAPVRAGEERKGDAKAQATDDAAAARGRPRPRAKATVEKPKDQPAAEKPAEFNPAESLKLLYRDVAKTMHPDLADSDESRAHRHTFMVRANEAYEAGDEQRLLAVFHEWESHPESVKGAGTAADLVRCIRKLDWCEQRLTAIAAEIEQLQTSGLFGMKMMADEAAQFERDLLSEMTARLDAEIDAARAYLAMLETQLAARE